MRTEHLLIIRLSAIGDVAMLVPVVASLAKQYPNLRITVLSKPFARALFENMSPNVGFMEFDLTKDNHGIHSLNTLYRRLVAKRFTAIADMHDVLRTKYLRQHLAHPHHGHKRGAVHIDLAVFRIHFLAFLRRRRQAEKRA